MSEGLKLLATEAADIEIISAALEGLITSLGEMKYQRRLSSFEITGSRFMWERRSTGDTVTQPFHRVRSGFHMGDVQSVRSLNMERDRPDDVQELLCINVTAKDDGQAVIVLKFAANRSIELAVECVNASLTDFGAPWKTERVPKHDLETGSPD